MRIIHLELKNIGVFEHQQFEFHKIKAEDKAEIHIFTGVNGSGKSTVLYALAGGFGPGFAVLKRFRFPDKRSFVKVQFDNHTEKILQFKDNESNSPDGYESDFRTGQEKYPHEFAVLAYSGSRSLVSSDIAFIKEITNSPLEKALDFDSSVNSQLLVQWIANTKAKAAFAFQEGKNQLAEKYNASVLRIENAVKEIVGHGVQFTFHYEPLAVGIKINNEELEFDVLSDGLKSVISWIADLLMRLERLKWVDDRNVFERNFILFLDEIEIHLHPSWQRKILPVVQKLFRNAQIFVATHSPFVVSSVNGAYVYKLSDTNDRIRLAGVEESKAGVSYPAVLDEIFGIEEYFDVETEKDFALFYRLKQKMLSGDDVHWEDFLNVSRKLSQKSVEVQDIIGRELRQLQRITGKDIEL